MLHVIAEDLMDQFAKGNFDQIELVYNRFKNAATQIITNRTIFTHCSCRR